MSALRAVTIANTELGGAGAWVASGVAGESGRADGGAGGPR